MMPHNTISSALRQLIQDDAVGQLRRRDGLMATLGSEDGVLKLDWVEGVARLLADPAQLEEVEAQARDIWQRGIRHLIWAGMGGSVLTVRVLCDLGFYGGDGDGQVTIYPLDSTDPAALNAIVRKIATAKKLTLSTGADAANPTFLRTLLDDVMMVGVAMGMTSEEPITHLEWFTALVRQAGLHPAAHLLVMTLPDSYLDRFAHAQQAPSFPLQPDRGTGTGGRMSTPTTRVFLLPAALYLTAHFPAASGQLRSMLQRAWDEYQLELATAHPAEHPFVQLAAALSAASRDGACRLLVKMPDGWQTVVAWLEQLMEESLGKGGKQGHRGLRRAGTEPSRSQLSAGGNAPCTGGDRSDPIGARSAIYALSTLPRQQRTSAPLSSTGDQLSGLAVEHGSLWLPATYSIRRTACGRELQGACACLTDAARPVVDRLALACGTPGGDAHAPCAR